MPEIMHLIEYNKTQKPNLKILFQLVLAESPCIIYHLDPGKGGGGGGQNRKYFN